MHGENLLDRNVEGIVDRMLIQFGNEFAEGASAPPGSLPLPLARRLLRKPATLPKRRRVRGRRIGESEAWGRWRGAYQWDGVVQCDSRQTSVLVLISVQRR